MPTTYNEIRRIKARCVTLRCGRKCDTELPVISGRKSTIRQVVCKSCGTRYDYSAWILRRNDAKTIYQIDLMPQDTTRA